MNNKRRQELQEIRKRLSAIHNEMVETIKNIESELGIISDMLSAVADNEQDCMDNMPENLQYSERYEKMENAVDNMSDGIEYIDKAIDSIREAMS